MTTQSYRDCVIEECIQTVLKVDPETRLDDPGIAAEAVLSQAVADLRRLKGNLLPDVSHGLHLFLDGDMWCAVGPHFRDLNLDRAGFGSTQLEAYEAWWAANEHSANIRAVVHAKPDFDQFTIHQ